MSGGLDDARGCICLFPSYIWEHFSAIDMIKCDWSWENVSCSHVIPTSPIKQLAYTKMSQNFQRFLFSCTHDVFLFSFCQSRFTAGILAEFNTGVMTNSNNFRCQTITGTDPDTAVPGWSGTQFNANGWPNAVVSCCCWCLFCFGFLGFFFKFQIGG